MAVKKEKKNGKTKSEANPASELRAPRWSVVSFEKCIAGSLTYDEAARKLEKFRAEKISGLCIVTDEAAQRVKSEKRKTKS